MIAATELPTRLHLHVPRAAPERPHGGAHVIRAAHAAGIAVLLALVFALGGCGGGKSWTARDVPEEYPTIQAAVDAAQPGRPRAGRPRHLPRAGGRRTGQARHRHTRDRSQPRRPRRRRRHALQRHRGPRQRHRRREPDRPRLRLRRDPLHPAQGRSRPAQRVARELRHRRQQRPARDRGAALARRHHRPRLASGHGAAGFRIGNCRPCDSLVTDSVAERGMAGFEGSDSGGNVVVARSSLPREPRRRAARSRPARRSPSTSRTRRWSAT